MNRTRRQHPGVQTVAVTHGDVCHLARGGYRGLPIVISSIRVPHPYPGKGSLTRFTFSDDLTATYPLSIEYYDPNGGDPAWNKGWIKMDKVGDAPQKDTAAVSQSARLRLTGLGIRLRSAARDTDEEERPVGRSDES